MPFAGEYAHPVRLRVGPGRAARLVITGTLTMATLLAVTLSAMAPHLKLLTLLFLSMGVLLLLTLRPDTEEAGLLVRGDGSARLTLATGQRFEGQWQSSAWVTPVLCVLKFRHGRGRYHLAVYLHRQAAIDFRRLVVLLRHAGTANKMDRLV